MTATDRVIRWTTAGAVVGVVSLFGLTEYQRAAWIRTDSEDSGHAGESS